MGLKDENTELKKRIKTLEEQAEFHLGLMQEHGDDGNRLHEKWDADKALLLQAQTDIASLGTEVAKLTKKLATAQRNNSVLAAEVTEGLESLRSLSESNRSLSKTTTQQLKVIADLAASLNKLVVK